MSGQHKPAAGGSANEGCTCVAVLNAGSSSIKFGIYDMMSGETLMLRGQVAGLGTDPRFEVWNGRGERLMEQRWPANDLDHAKATEIIIAAVRELLGRGRLVAIGHRVVHGGTQFSAPVRINSTVLEALETLVPLAPLHQPHNLAPIKAIAVAAPHIDQVACFDTAFHREQPPLAQLFGLPRKFTDAGIRRYGFHGLSYEYVTARLAVLAPELARGRVIVAHLGNGASLCAIRDGRSIASTMGFTALDGLLMGSRCGALDPGVLIHLIDAYRMDARELEDLVYRRSGLLGVSGLSSDMRALRASSEPAAAEAIYLFVYRVTREIGSLTAALGGLDALVFTGGIGEHDAATRAEIVAACAWLGMELDPERNSSGECAIGSDASRVSVWMIPTDEEKMVARHTKALLQLDQRDRKTKTALEETS